MVALKKFDQFLGKFEVIAIGLALGIASLLNVIQVVARYFFNVSFNTFDEISVYLMISVVFIGMARADSLKQNISVDIAHSILGKRTARKLHRVSDALLCVIAFLLMYFTFDSVLFSKMIGESSVSSLGIAIWPIMAVMPASFLLVGIRAGLRSFGISNDYQDERPEAGAHI